MSKEAKAIRKFLDEALRGLEKNQVSVAWTAVGERAPYSRHFWFTFQGVEVVLLAEYTPPQVRVDHTDIGQDAAPADFRARLLKACYARDERQDKAAMSRLQAEETRKENARRREEYPDVVAKIRKAR